ncbi:MAG: DHH family phosphoesterase [Erysipelotrichaceae bacterium]|nr:DHH family phosphoesterase [Erysipelotrichaceae bacterium]
MNRTDKLKFYALAVLLVQIAVLIVLRFFFGKAFSVVTVIFTLIDAAVIALIVFAYEKALKSRVMDTTRVLGNDAKDGMVYAQLGIVSYDDDYIVTWASELLDERGIKIIGEKITRVIPGVEVLLNGETDKDVFVIKEREYEITKASGSRTLFMKDVTEYNSLNATYNNEKTVLGLIYLDNYDETVQYEDERKIALINTNIRQKIVEWGTGYGAVVRRVRSDRFTVVINEGDFRRMLYDKFSILEEIKEEADKLDVAISASMAFAYGSSNLNTLDTVTNELLELVLSRGGDQVAVREIGQEVRFYGASSDASEKTSKVKARVISQTLRGIIKEADNVFVVPHKEADFDAVGACLGVSRIAQALGKRANIVLEGIAIENSARAVLEDNYDELESRHNIISERDAIELLTRKSVVVVVDHHSSDLTSAPDLVSRASKIVIIDHHRRKTETNISAMLIYNEPSSSSAVELVSELIQYQPEEVELDEFESTYMYTGLVVDTDGFKSRCSGRSFEVCAFLRKKGADIALSNEWLKESIDEFETKTKILKYSRIINNNMLIAALPESEGSVTRTMVAQVANSALSIKGVDAAFVIARIDGDIIALSGRSNGTVNVQLIREKLGGGGHFTAAGLQRTDTTVEAVHSELVQAINEFLEGDVADENHTS